VKLPEPATHPKIVLAIEAGIRGGSISLLKGGREEASWHGTTDKSRAEDLLVNISNLFEQTNIGKSSLNAIAVSNGPGSYTGIRIGLATALGLKNALEIDCIGVPLLYSIAYAYSEMPKSIVGVPIGRSEICWQSFERIEETVRPYCSARSGSADDFLEAIRELSDFTVILQSDLYDLLSINSGFDALQSRMIDCGRNLAFAVGIAAQSPGAVSDLQPFYIQNSRFSSVNV